MSANFDRSDTVDDMTTTNNINTAIENLDPDFTKWLQSLDSGRPIPEGEHELFANLVTGKFAEAHAPLLLGSGITVKGKYAILTDATMLVSIDLAGMRTDVTLHLNFLDLFNVAVEYNDLMLAELRNVDITELGPALLNVFQEILRIGSKGGE